MRKLRRFLIHEICDRPPFVFFRLGLILIQMDYPTPLQVEVFTTLENRVTPFVGLKVAERVEFLEQPVRYPGRDSARGRRRQQEPEGLGVL